MIIIQAPSGADIAERLRGIEPEEAEAIAAAAARLARVEFAASGLTGDPPVVTAEMVILITEAAAGVIERQPPKSKAEALGE